MARSLTGRVSDLETRLDRLLPAPPTPDRYQAEMLALAAYTIGPENAAALQALIPTGGHWFPCQLIDGIAFGAPDSEIARTLAYYQQVQWASPLPAALAIVTGWLEAPVGQERWIDPYWLLRYEYEHGLCGHKEFAYDLATAAVMTCGTAEAQASLPTPPAPDARYGPWDWRKQLAGYWDAIPVATLWEHLALVVHCLAVARDPAVFDEGDVSTTDRDRTIDAALGETLVQEHRAWLRWTTSTSPAQCPPPARWRPMPLEQWCEELRAAVADGRLPDEVDDDNEG